LFDIDLGVKGGMNAAGLVVETKFASKPVETHFEGDDAFGFGGHGGLYAQVRLWDRVGLEVDVLYSHDQTVRTEKYNLGLAGTADLEHTDWATTLRIPVLLKVFHVVGPAALSLGFGPEWVTMLDNGHDIAEAESSDVTIAEKSLEDARKAYESVAADMLFLVGQAEVAFEVGPVSIPISLRAGKNLWQSDTFEDRYDYELQGMTIVSQDVQPIYSWDFRVLTGVALRL